MAEAFETRFKSTLISEAFYSSRCVWQAGFSPVHFFLWVTSVLYHISGFQRRIYFQFYQCVLSAFKSGGVELCDWTKWKSKWANHTSQWLPFCWNASQLKANIFSFRLARLNKRSSKVLSRKTHLTVNWIWWYIRQKINFKIKETVLLTVNIDQVKNIEVEFGKAW